MSTRTTTPAKRYAKLVNDLGQEVGFARGWMSRAADQLGVHRSYVSMFHRGERNDIGTEVVDRAAEKMSIDPKYFFDESLDEPSYRDFQRGVKLVFPAGEKPYRQVGEHRFSDTPSMWPVGLAIEAARDDASIEDAERFGAQMTSVVSDIEKPLKVILDRTLSDRRRISEAQVLAHRILEQERRANAGPNPKDKRDQ